MQTKRVKLFFVFVASAVTASCAHYEYDAKRVYKKDRQGTTNEIPDIRTLNGSRVVDATTSLDIDDDELNQAIQQASNSATNPLKITFSEGIYNNALGDFDFTQDTSALKGAVIKMEFDIPDRFADRLKFMPDARDAIWIDFKQNTGGESPERPYPVGQSEFFNFIVSESGQKLIVFNRNKTKDVYVYNLRFVDKNGNVHQFDPEVGNGGHGND